MSQQHIQQAAALVRAGSHVAALTGAGVSTPSGIPDFRSPGSGLWTHANPLQVASIWGYHERPADFYRWFLPLAHTIRAAYPNSAHHALARLEGAGLLDVLITQNIDGLHQASGVPDDVVIELHGNSTYATCLECGKRHEIAWAKEVFADNETLPHCTDCGGIVKTATISFGQAMPEDEMMRAQAATLAADLFIVLGSSLVVYPAAGFPILAKENGSRLVIINREPTDQDSLADLVINAEIGATMSYVVGVN